jgi:FtsP/CotA-like multicopper oxidase with cupredoxin domain
MKFTVVPLTAPDTSMPVDQLVLPTLTALGAPLRTRKLSLNEAMSDVLKDVGPREALLGTVDEMGCPMPMIWMEPITENPRVGDTEVWEIYNFTADAHPIHLHQVMFQVVNRQPLLADEEGIAVAPATPIGPPAGPESWETGFKDTVIAYPGQITRIKAKFDIAGLYVWHCHIVEHEDNEMMRPYRVEP